jgi:hypothetical protein
MISTLVVLFFAASASFANEMPEEPSRFEGMSAHGQQEILNCLDVVVGAEILAEMNGSVVSAQRLYNGGYTKDYMSAMSDGIGRCAQVAIGRVTRFHIIVDEVRGRCKDEDNGLFCGRASKRCAYSMYWRGFFFEEVIRIAEIIRKVDALGVELEEIQSVALEQAGIPAE